MAVWDMRVFFTTTYFRADFITSIQRHTVAFVFSTYHHTDSSHVSMRYGCVFSTIYLRTHFITSSQWKVAAFTLTIYLRIDFITSILRDKAVWDMAAFFSTNYHRIGCNTGFQSDLAVSFSAVHFRAGSTTSYPNLHILPHCNSLSHFTQHMQVRRDALSMTSPPSSWMSLAYTQHYRTATQCNLPWLLLWPQVCHQR